MIPVNSQGSACTDDLRDGAATLMSAVHLLGLRQEASDPAVGASNVAQIPYQMKGWGTYLATALRTDLLSDIEVLDANCE